AARPAPPGRRLSPVPHAGALASASGAGGATGLSGSDGALLAVIVVLLLASSFFALAETGLTRMTRPKVLALVEEERRGAHTLLALLNRPEEFLNMTLLCALTCQTVAASLLGVVSYHVFGALGVAVGTALDVIFVFVVGEAAPKTWAVQHSERAALIAAPIISGILGFPPARVLSRGLIWMANLLLPGKGLRRGPFVSEQELLAMADVAAEEEVIESEERALIRSIIDFGDTVVREVMVPRPDMIAVSGEERAGSAAELAISAGYSRIPVFEKNVDDIIGVVLTKDLMRGIRQGGPEQPVRNLVRPAHFVPETKRVAELMREMQKEKFHIAIVVDEYGGTAGLVTLEDLIEELVGEIVDEFDVEEPLIEPLADGTYRVNARMSIGELNDLLHADLPAGDWDTVGGLVFNMLGHVPSEGESVVAEDHRLVAERVQGRRIGRVRISRLQGSEEPAAERA
ncbi:MAG TPA: hemolysin family protein, partial [Acidimicrobiales bacterium]|nr:hemolysin family protein [Acidimicrobiales bacterium]